MVRRLRLASGLVLLAFVASHLLNHALGLVSLDALEAGRRVFVAVWRSAPFNELLIAAVACHLLLALWGIYRRRILRMRRGEIVQAGLGLAIPLLLMPHFVGTRGLHEMHGFDDTYRVILLFHWVLDTDFIAIQTAGLLAAWVHGGLGVHFWLRLKPFYERIHPFLYAAFLIVPLLALLGYAQAGRAVIELAQAEGWIAEQLALSGLPGPDRIADALRLVDALRIGLLGAVALAFAARFGRNVVERGRAQLSITYPDGRVVSTPPGATLLEISRRFGIPHASVCGGRGRCSTCRVRITEGLEGLAPARTGEQRVLDRIGKPINVRLACQLRPRVDLAVVPLLPPTADVRESHRSIGQLQGEEREIAVLFADLRAFTEFSERALPYDVVFVLNRYFAGMGEAVAQSGGHLDKFIGDGVMALFGVDGDYAAGCRRAILAAREMSKRLSELNRALAHGLSEPLRIGIGVHGGPAIVGEMGYGAAFGVTAIGDTVNTASRLESASKEYGAELVVSQAVVDTAGFDLSAFPSFEVALRGRSGTVPVRVVERALTLPREPGDEGGR